MKISVIIVAYLRKEFIVSAVRSVFEQSLDREKYEIIVVKNFLDKTIDQILVETADKNLYSTEKSLGKKLELGIINSSGEIICFLEDDDYYKPGKLETVYKSFNNTQSLVYLRDSHDTILEFNGEIRNYPFIHHTRSNCIFSLKNASKQDLISFFNFDQGNLSSIAIRRSAIIGNQGILSSLPYCFDTFMLFSALLTSQTIFLNKESLTTVRLHSQNWSIIAYETERSAFIEHAMNIELLTMRALDELTKMCQSTPLEYISKHLRVESRIRSHILGNRMNLIPYAKDSLFCIKYTLISNKYSDFMLPIIGLCAFFSPQFSRWLYAKRKVTKLAKILK